MARVWIKLSSIGCSVQTEHFKRTASGANQFRRRTGQVDDRRWLGATRTVIKDQLQLILKAILDFPTFSQRKLVTRQLQRRGQKRFVQFFKQGQCDRMIRDTQADGLALRM